MVVDAFADGRYGDGLLKGGVAFAAGLAMIWIIAKNSKLSQ